MKTVLMVLVGILVLAVLGTVAVGLIFVPVRAEGVIPTPVISHEAAPAAPQAAPTALPAAQPAKVEPTQPAAVPQTGGATPQAAWTGVVNADPLNLRLGPGKGYPIARTLDTGQEVRLEGRSSDGRWLVVVLPDGSAGWVAADYIDTTVAMNSLPVKEASGGLAGSGAKPTSAPVVKKFNILVDISDNIATVSLSRFPADADVVLSLGLPGQGADRELATAHTDSSGSATISFEMPARWSDGSSITETSLSMVAATADGKFSRTAKIQYFQ